MRNFLVGSAVVLALTAAVGVAADRASVGGAWTMAVSAPPPHGDFSMALTLAQSGRKVTGTLAPPQGGSIPLEGEFDKGSLVLAAPSDAKSSFSLTATLRDDGTLSGVLSGERGDMTWTAKRAGQRR